jgi:hypothetical protein
MKRKKIIKLVNKSLEHFKLFKDPSDKEVGYTRALIHIKELLENK